MPRFRGAAFRPRCPCPPCAPLPARRPIHVLRAVPRAAVNFFCEASHFFAQRGQFYCVEKTQKYGAGGTPRADTELSKTDAAGAGCAEIPERADDDPVARTAAEAFGVEYLYPWQRLVIANILDSFRYTDAEKAEDAAYRGRQIVLLPTGAGKSLCFQIPALLLRGATLVVYPLLALMSDQRRRLAERGIESVVFRGGQTEAERLENFRRIRDGAKIIIANPEALASEKLCRRLCECGIAHIAVDEAHCVSEWGDSFRPAYLELGKIIKRIGAPVVTAFTATASPEVLERVSKLLFDGEAHVVRGESDRPNIHYAVRYAAAKRQAAVTLAATEKRPMIIFCGTRFRAEDLAKDLVLCFGGESARFYHAGLEKDEKEKTERWFLERDDAVLCATCAYGMGVDKKNIRTVVHLDPPPTAEAYVQEAGRAGRDGLPAAAILLWNQADSREFAFFGRGSRAAAMRDFAENAVCRREALLNALGAESPNPEERPACGGCDLCDARRKTESRSAERPRRITPRNLGHLIAARKTGAEKEYRDAARKTPPETKRRAVTRVTAALKSRLTAESGGAEISDIGQVLRMVMRRNLCYTRAELEKEAAEMLNRRSRAETGLNLWDAAAVSEITEQLLSQRKIAITGRLRGNTVTAAGRDPLRRALRRSARLFRLRPESVRRTRAPRLSAPFSSAWAAFCCNWRHSSRNSYTESRPRRSRLRPDS